MSFIDGVSSIHNTDQHHKRIVDIGHKTSPLLTRIGMNGILGTNKDEVKWTAYNYNQIAGAKKDNLEGQKASGAKVFLPESFSNHFEIFHEMVSITYSQSTSDPDDATSRANFERQKKAAFINANKQLANSVFYGQKVAPGTQGVAPKMDGLVTAIKASGNNNDAGLTPLTADLVNETIQMIYETTGASGDLVAVMNPTMKAKWNKVFKGDRDLVDPTKSVLYNDAVFSDFGKISTMIDINIKDNADFASATGMNNSILFLSVDEINLVFKEIIRQSINGETIGGYAFLEQLAKVGLSDDYQLNFEALTQYNHAKNHALLTNIG